ncbi:MAG: O-antigen ligase family protein [Pseudomonadota bacterium]
MFEHISVAASRRPGSPTSAATRDLRSWLAGYILAATGVAAIPVGLNRPSLWLVWGICICLLALVYLVILHRTSPVRSLQIARMPWLLGLALAIPAYGAIQALPLGRWLDLDGLRASISLLPSASSMGALRFTFYIVFAMLVLEAANRRDRAELMSRGLFAAAVAQALWALVALRLFGDMHYWGEKTAYLGAATGTFINRNALATYLGMGGCLGIALMSQGLGRPRGASLALLAATGLAIIALALFATQSRMGIAASALGWALCVTLVFWQRMPPLLQASWSAVLLLAPLCVLVLGSDALLLRVFETESDLRERLAGYTLVLQLIAERPVLGHGFDAFRPAFERVHLAPLDPSLIWDRAHSTYLSHWVELGLLAGSLPLLLGLALGWRLFRRAGALPAAALAALVIASTHALVDFSLEMPANAILLIAILGLGLAPVASPQDSPRSNLKPNMRRPRPQSQDN